MATACSRQRSHTELRIGYRGTDTGNAAVSDQGKVDIANFETMASGMTARGSTKLYDIDKFWDTNGRFLLTDPQTITVTQGDGKREKITLYSDDTIDASGKN